MTCLRRSRFRSLNSFHSVTIATASAPSAASYEEWPYWTSYGSIFRAFAVAAGS